LKATPRTRHDLSSGLGAGARRVFPGARERVSAPAESVAWWEWPTVLSLDAPAVAVLWQWMLARSLDAPLRAPEVFILAASVWLSYVADRWLEAWRLDRVYTRRHRFYQRHRWPTAGIWLGVLLGDVGVALLDLTPAELKGGFLLLVAVLLYLFSHQMVHRRSAWRAPKEICVAVLLGAGASLFPGARMAPALGPLVAPLALFMLLCFANCVLISAWEAGVDALQGQTSIALQFREGSALGAAVPWVVAALAASGAAWIPGGPGRIAAGCALASGLLLGALHGFEPAVGRRRARVLADLALMTPIVPLAWWWLR
jgi:hypothetical protein